MSVPAVLFCGGKHISQQWHLEQQSHSSAHTQTLSHEDVEATKLWFVGIHIG